jgi:glucose dehydrogenase
MTRARPLSEGDGTYILTPHEVRIALDGLSRAPSYKSARSDHSRTTTDHDHSRMGAYQSRMSTVNEAWSVERADEVRLRRRRLFIAAMLALIALAAIAGAVVFWVNDSRPLPHSRRLKASSG